MEVVERTHTALEQHLQAAGQLQMETQVGSELLAAVAAEHVLAEGMRATRTYYPERAARYLQAAL